MAHSMNIPMTVNYHPRCKQGESKERDKEGKKQMIFCMFNCS